jgi:hypothetical protein
VPRCGNECGLDNVENHFQIRKSNVCVKLPSNGLGKQSGPDILAPCLTLVTLITEEQVVLAHKRGDATASGRSSHG